MAKNIYGDFYDNGWEYHIYTPETPYPWFNYLFSDKYHSIISHTGGGFSYAIDPKVNRILKYDNVDNDMPGRYLFLKMDDKIWSANWQPLKKKMDNWLTIVSPGYTIIKSLKYGIECEIKYFVPINETIEIYNVKIRNINSLNKKITLYPFVDIISGDADLEVRFRNIMRLYNVAKFDKKLSTIIFHKKPFPAREFKNYSFFMCDTKIKSFETNKLNFFGIHHTIENPIELKSKSLSNSETTGEDMVGVFQIELNLRPDETKEVNIILGFAENKGYIKNIRNKYFVHKHCINEAFNETKQYWRETLKKFWIETGDEDIDRMVNIWGKYQLLGITRWRGSSPYHGTEGGLGYRDLAQDVEGIAGLDATLAKNKLMDLLQFQYSNGNAVSGYSVIEGPWDINPDAKIVSGKSDVAIWLPNAVVKYIKVTGDWNFLKQKVKYLDKGEDTVYNHIIRAVEYVATTTGKHKLPLIKIADWNDAFDKVGRGNKGESIWLGEAVCWASLIVKELADYLQDWNVSKKMEQIYNDMRKNINKYGWNGRHYIAAYNDYYEKIGDKSISLNSQTWAIIGKVYEKKFLPKILKAIDSLDTPYGNLLFKPPYHNYNDRIGRVTSFAEGTKENAAVFSHAVAFKVVADIMANRKNEAFKTIKKLLPTSRYKKDLNRYKVEPYVWAEYVIGKGNKNYGQGSFTWNTGTAVWTYIGLTEWIIGIKPTFDGLKIQPNLPDNIKNVKVRMFFRNKPYNIEIINNKGNAKIFVNGTEVDGSDTIA